MDVGCSSWLERKRIPRGDLWIQPCVIGISNVIRVALFRHYLRYARCIFMYPLHVVIQKVPKTFSPGITRHRRNSFSSISGVVSGTGRIHALREAGGRGFRIRPGRTHLLFTRAANGTVLRPLVCSLYPLASSYPLIPPIILPAITRPTE